MYILKRKNKYYKVAVEGKTTKWKTGRTRFTSKWRMGFKDKDIIPSTRGKNLSFSVIGRKGGKFYGRR